MNVELHRKNTPGCELAAHLNNAGAALMPSSVISAVRDYLDYEALHGGYETYAARLKDISRFYRSAAALVGAKSRNIAFTGSATDAYSRALSSFDFKPGDVILTSRNDYTSNQIQFLSLKRRCGVEVIHVPDLPEGGVDPAALKNLAAKHKPRLVSITHIPTNSGLIQDVESVGKVCRDLEIPYMVDACQSVGQMPVDALSMHCDFLSVTMRKFLRGPRGAGFLYISDTALEKGYEPLLIDMRGADWISLDSYKPRDDAKRFEEWEHNFAMVVGSDAACRYALETGLESIRDYIFGLAEYMRNALGGIDRVRSMDEGLNRGAICTFHIEGGGHEELHKFLMQRRIHSSVALAEYNLLDFGERKKVDWALRLAPHYYNTKEEVDLCATAIEEYVRGLS